MNMVLENWNYYTNISVLGICSNFLFSLTLLIITFFNLLIIQYVKYICYKTSDRFKKHIKDIYKLTRAT